MAMEGCSAFPKALASLKTSPSDCSVSYPGHSLRGVLPLCRDAASVFYSPSRLGNIFQGVAILYIYIYIFIYNHAPHNILLNNVCLRLTIIKYQIQTVTDCKHKQSLNSIQTSCLKIIHIYFWLFYNFCHYLVFYCFFIFKVCFWLL